MVIYRGYLGEGKGCEHGVNILGWGKKIRGPSLGFLYGRGSRAKINSFQKIPPPTQIINCRPLRV